MNSSSRPTHRLQFLARMVQKEITYLQQTDRRLFEAPFTREKAGQLEQDIDLAERVDAFVSRFGRLQDTVGDKLLPAYLSVVGEHVGTALDNLNRAEKLGWVESVEIWMALRGLRNQMVHEYMEDLDQLAEALNKGHEYVPMLVKDATSILVDMETRGSITPQASRT
ncbi:MAG: hypothetical protein KDF59_11960 [Nitrosomonas sp.]|nr:hypothetical protein [Nitrosomonas sp.]